MSRAPENDAAAANAQALDRFRALFALPRSQAAQIIGESGVGYFPEYFDGRVPVESYIEKVRLMLRLCGGPGKRVLDVGCGHGFVACLLAALGAREAVGVDLSDEKIPHCKALAAYMGLSNVSFQASAGERLPFADESFDAVCISAALSHVNDIDATLLQMRRVLGPGGTLYVFEDNNALHPSYHKRIDPVLEFAETGKGRAGHASSGDWVPYIERRAAMIRDWFPELAPDRVAALAAAAKGLVGDEIRAAVAENLRTGKPVVVAKDFLYYAPDTGEAMEYPFTPPLLRSVVSRHFTDVQIHSAWTPPYRGLKGVVKRVLKVLGAACPPLMHRTQATYIVTGRKA